MTAEALCLHGYGPSVYSRIARLTLTELRLPFDWAETDPFSDGSVPHPMRRVPVLKVGVAAIYETAAITRYLDRMTGGTLTPSDALSAARMDQVLGIVDAYAYWPLVRQVYAHAVFRPANGLDADPGIARAGLDAAVPVLAMLEEIAAEGRVLAGERTLADCHLAPILAAFAEARDGRERLAAAPALEGWFDGLTSWSAFLATGS